MENWLDALESKVLFVNFLKCVAPFRMLQCLGYGHSDSCPPSSTHMHLYAQKIRNLHFSNYLLLIYTRIFNIKTVS